LEHGFRVFIQEIAGFVLSDGVLLLEIFVLQQEFGGLRVREGVLLLGIGRFVLECLVFVLPDGVFLLPAAVACMKSPCSCWEPGRASRESRRSGSRAASSMNSCYVGKPKKGTVTGLTSGTEYWFPVRAIGAADPSPWSDPATKRAT